MTRITIHGAKPLREALKKSAPKIVKAIRTVIDRAAVEPQPGVYEHYKGGFYYVHGVGIHTDTSLKLVIYQEAASPGRWFARPLEQWNDPVIVGNTNVLRFKRLEKHR